MDEYTPTTDEVRMAYHFYGKYPELAPGDLTVTEAEFNRWLAEHDRVVAANAWHFCLDEIEANELNTQQAREGNPYRITEENN